MKKMICFSLLGFLVFLGIAQLSYASDVHLPKGLNYLDLSNIRVGTDGEPVGSTFEPIYIKSDVTYTIVLSSIYLGQHYDYIDYVEVRLYDEEDIYEIIKTFQVDYVNNYAYFEFSMNANWLHIEGLPISIIDNYEAMMYEGTYQTFPGFHPYIDETETMSYHGYLPMDYDDLKTIDTIKTYVDAKNHRDETILFDIVEDNYSSSLKKPGVYHLLFQTTSNQITKPLYLEIEVFDLTAPVITFDDAIEIPLSEKLSIDTIQSQIIVTDNVDDLTHEDLIIIEDTYTTASTVGDYHVVFKAVDASGNESSKRIDINLVDKKPPIITGPSLIYVYTTDPVLTVQEILSRFSVYDDVDGTSVNINVGINTYLNHDIPGIYQFYMTSSDREGNTANFMLHIHVIENRGPSFSMTEHVMAASTKASLTEDEIIDWFKNQALSQGHDVSKVSVKLNEYEGHETSRGHYYVYLNYELEGETYMTRVLVEVNEEKTPIPFLPIVIGLSTLSIGFITFLIIKKKK